MKSFSLFLIASIISLGSFSQSFEKGTTYLHLGVGIGGGFSSGTITLPPVGIGLETGVTDRISVGAIAAYSSSKYSFFSSDEIKYNYLLLGARGNYHFATSEKFDPYAGLTLGYNLVKVTMPSTISGYTAKASGLLYGAQIGANYYFSDNIGAFAELGYGIGIFTIGLTAKF